MKEFAFPIAAIALVFLLMIPTLSLMSYAALAYKRAHTRNWLDFAGDSTMAWLVAPTLVPVVWLISSALHHGETAQALQACLVEHSMLLTTCLDVVIVLGVVGIATGSSVLVKALQDRVKTCGDTLEDQHPMVGKLAEIIAADPRLKSRSISVVRNAPAAIFTYGWFRPRFFVDACFVRDNDSQILRAALLHELAHARDLDPLRIFVARICLILNPLGRLLAPDFERWRDAREGVCDAEAVRLGGDPLSLAEGILSAARFHKAQTAHCGMSMLCGHDAATLRLRVALLMDGHLGPRRTLGRLALSSALVAVIVVPHLADPSALEHFHYAVENLLFGIPS